MGRHNHEDWRDDAREFAEQARAFFGRGGFGGGGRGGFGGRGWPPGGPGWPPGGPGWPFGRGPGPRVKRGDVRAAVLALLAEEPRNGYQIIQEIAQRSGGLWRPGSGSVYPALQLLEDEGLVRAEEHEGKKRFRLTDEGKAYVRSHKEELENPWGEVASTVDDGAVNIHVHLGQLGMALVQIFHGGDAKQIARARQVLLQARKSLYQILAEADDGTEPDE
ncbi:MAG: PadR family transcriptional regulator [Deltaproteobacteria bacterium]|nr:PadR family transcriptional regulator [Deltaproteobacteria bacterium]